MDKINMTINIPIYLKRGLEELSYQNSKPMNEIIISALERTYPETFVKHKKAQTRRVIPA